MSKAQINDALGLWKVMDEHIVELQKRHPSVEGVAARLDIVIVALKTIMAQNAELLRALNER